ncbi:MULTISPECIES: 2OG-Fe(II) oxygenase [unclassified Rhizobium]|uniref:2OG-Fe(II) oxygenase n=1 Tax=unclassified Rhizobium TaxID=2613769 RepID=UPI0016100846|nr:MULTISPECIES: 2OG-Fe(II) oxygenase [unclassified Rhizobium]MBB3541664.1 peroxiredoxin/predicted 2-oxoglutarate/Fe(II)-dependent dioxygenase YbiX [Rhizobium sp. BK399]MCS3740757.1 peroxiredoxin/predicted 2-oxoglutarate/Fe(II)-dependent dioxygenase YbiX [Rhizobium sp. BK661]MCS4092408.1 peroxiredoxin/predicted 2-oxoglutarate/Fe(II)-dependent dioxygenase YbiX [Rhizobium sp. BK176]
MKLHLAAGDPAPRFIQRTLSNPRYVFDVAAGRYMVLYFFGSTASPNVTQALEKIRSRPAVFNGSKVAFFGVTVDPKDETHQGIADQKPGIKFFLDFDLSVSKLYGAVSADAQQGGVGVTYRQVCVVLDPTMRVRATFVPGKEGSGIDELIAYLETLPPVERSSGLEMHAPVIVLPDVFETDLCHELINLYERHGGQESGFMREINGKTVLVSDHNHKRRRDHTIEDDALMAELRGRFIRRIIPEIKKVHQFEATRMERYIVSCYDADEEAHFKPHRDNTTKGTAHRRFAVSVNLNNDFDGGEVSFPEYGNRTYKAPPGGAVVFSCSLLHAVSKVTRGRRYAFLPFLYDEAAAKVREENSANIEDGANATA